MGAVSKRTEQRAWSVEPADEASENNPLDEPLDDRADEEQTLRIVPHGDAWAIRVGSGEIERVFPERREAFRNAKAWATREERWVVLHPRGEPPRQDSPG